VRNKIPNRFSPVPTAQLLELIEFANTGKLKRLLSLPAALEPASLKVLRDQVRGDLVTIARHKPLPVDDRIRLETQALKMTFHVSSFDYRLREFEFSMQADTPLDVQTSFLTLLLLRQYPDREFPGDLCQCQLESCGDLFFASEVREAEVGRMRWRFCGPEHFKKQRSIKSTERVARWRAAKHK
jgi:hypothetical protein